MIVALFVKEDDNKMKFNSIVAVVKGLMEKETESYKTKNKKQKNKNKKTRGKS